MSRLLPIAAVVMSLGAAAASAQAAPAIVSFTVGSQFTGFSTDETVGWSFRVAAGPGVAVSALGWWDANLDGLAASHQVGIWDTAGVLLGTATVGVSDPLIGSFRYASLSEAISLSGGATYIIGGRDLVGDGDNYSSSNGALVMDPQIEFLSAARSSNASGFAFPGISSANSGGRFGPNFMLTPVPEPGTYALMALGLFTVGAVARRRRG